MAFLTQCHNDTNFAKFQLFTNILGKEFKIAWSGASSEEVCWLDRIPENLSVDKGSAKTSGQERRGGTLWPVATCRSLVGRRKGLSRSRLCCLNRLCRELERFSLVSCAV